MKSSESFGRELLRAAKQGFREHFNIAALLPASGAMGLLGPSAYACARLACEIWNEADGVDGRQVRLTVLDSGEGREALDAEVHALLRSDELDALVVLSNTDVCERISRVVGARAPVVYTPQFEGAGLPEWVHAIGETPDRQLVPAIDWMANRFRTRRWFLLGSDYCWPRQTHATAIRHLRSSGAEVVAERYVALGERDFTPIVEHLARSKADAVLINLVGSDAIHMCRAFGAAGLSSRMLRLSNCVEENALMGMGSLNTAGMFVSAGYFASVDSDANGSFKERYHQRFGERAPALNSQAQSIYEGFVHLRRQTLAARSRKSAILDSVRARRAPAGTGSASPVYLAEAEGMRMRVIQPLAGAPG